MMCLLRLPGRLAVIRTRAHALFLVGALAAACNERSTVSRERASLGDATDVVAGLRARFTTSNRRVIGEGEIAGFDRGEQGIVPRAATGAHQPARVSLPEAADGPFVVAAGDVSVSVRIASTRHALAEVTRDAVLYRAALEGADLLQVPTHAGTEEFLHFASKPARNEARYEIELHGVAGLRLVEGVLELLSADGNPVIRTTAPTVIDARGTAVTGTLRVEGCAVDLDARLPWGRAVTPPGKASCTVVTSWSDAGLSYPILVDPAWVKTTVLSKPRASHSAAIVQRADVAACTAGCVLVAGGDAFPAPAPELYNVATATWTAVAALPTNTWRHAEAGLANGKFLVVGGWVSPGTTSSAQSVVYDPKVGTWAATGASPLDGPMVSVALPLRQFDATGKVTSVTGLVMATNGTSWSVYRENTNDWTAAAAMPRARGDFAIGGFTTPCTTSCTQNGYAYLVGGTNSKLVDVWNAFSGTWASASDLAVPRGRLTVVDVGDRLLFAGGYSASDGALHTEIDYVLKSAPTVVANAGFKLVNAHDSGVPGSARAAGTTRGLVISGIGPLTDKVEVLSSTTAVSTKMAFPRANAAAVDLPSGAVMVIGGTSGSGATYPTNEEIYLPQANGVACTAAADCASLFCVDGVCCQEACTGNCSSCNTAGKAGQCVAISGTPVGGRPACTGAGTTCGSTCDGVNKASCTFAAATKSCVAASCTGGVETHAAFCNGTGACNTATTKPCDGYACAATACHTSCVVNTDCSMGYRCDTSTGLCVSTGEAGSPCDAAHVPSDCKSGLTCVDGSCCTATACTAPKRCNVDGAKGSCKIPLGEACSAAADCGSGLCVDGVCCSTSCTGQCEACDVDGSKGTCAPVVGAAHGSRAACSDGGGDACKVMECDGNRDRTACVAFKNSTETECSPASCTAGSAIAPGKCDGAGVCSIPAATTCAPFACDAKICKTTCAADSDCAPGNVCNASTCVTATSTCSEDGQSSLPADKSPAKACAPFACDRSTGNCFGTCATSEQCGVGYVCDGTQCVAVAPETGSDGGCSLSPKHDPRWLALLGAAVAVGLLRQRRRSAS
jgi:hypothetical protein